MKTRDDDRAAVRFPPPLVFALVIAVAVALDRWLLPLPLVAAGGARRLVAIGLLLFAAGLMVAALVLFLRSGQNPEPWTSTPCLVFGGPYRLTRNPMYLGMAALQSAAGLWYANGWLLALVPLSLLGVYRVAVRHEEAYLERKFGEPYREYMASVRRWL